jgi:hypothetical protein
MSRVVSGTKSIISFNKLQRTLDLNIIVIFFLLSCRLVWCPGQNKRIAPLSFLHGCRKRRLKDLHLR